MDRRSFLKLGALFMAAMAVESSPALRAAADLLETQPNRVVLYLIKTRKGQWKVLWTSYIDMPKKWVNLKRWDESTFRVLEIVDESVANERRDILWDEYNCSGSKGWRISNNVREWQKLSVNHPNSIAWRTSEDCRVHLFTTCQRRRGRIGGAKAKESGQLYEAIELAKKYWTENPEHQKELGKRLGSIYGPINRDSGHASNMGKLYGPIQARKNVESGLCAKNLPKMIEASVKRRMDDRVDRLQAIMEDLPNQFTSKVVKEVCAQHGLTPRYAFRVLRNQDLCKMIYEGTNGSQTDVPIYEKIA